MTTYTHTVTLLDVEINALEKLIKDAICKFKEDHPDSAPTVPWVWESTLNKLENAAMNLSSSNNFTEGGNTIFMFNDPSDSI